MGGDEKSMKDLLDVRLDVIETDIEIVAKRDLSGKIEVYIGEYRLKNVLSIEDSCRIILVDGTNINLNTGKKDRIFFAAKCSPRAAEQIISADKEVK